MKEDRAGRALGGALFRSTEEIEQRVGSVSHVGNQMGLGIFRVRFAREFLAQRKDGDPLRILCNQTSPYGRN